MPKGFVYILECADGSLYTGSTIDLNKRLDEHQSGNGSNHTKKRLPVKLVYIEEFQRIDDAFYREKQIQGWSRNKKLALINNNFDDLKKFSECQNDSHFKNVASTPLSHQKPTRLNSNECTTPEREHYFSNGKLLLTAEYVVLDGALSLAIPTKYGQSLIVETINEPKIIWNSFDEMGNVWFNGKFVIENGTLKQVQRDGTSNRLLQILNVAKKINPNFLYTDQGFSITTKLNFPRQWGLGTSSTLINNVAQWAKVDAYQLLKESFGGSGYDIACAQHNKPITYQLFDAEMLKQVQEDETKAIKEVDFNPSFKAHLFFVYLNKKQNSRDGIAHYRKNASNLSDSISKINSITQGIISCKTLDDFIMLIEKHEGIISKVNNQKTVKDLLFNDFNGGIKSLGAWGGDFILVATKNNPLNYFKNKGFETIIPYNDMIL